MDSDERDIIQYLHTWGEQFVSFREIARRANKRRFLEDTDWPRPVLMRLVDHGVVEGDISGRYRLMPEEEGEQWVAPDIEKLLREDGEPGSEISEGESGDEPFERR
jgi:hypothetical protein